jgi:hypothetical protein
VSDHCLERTPELTSHCRRACRNSPHGCGTRFLFISLSVLISRIAAGPHRRQARYAIQIPRTKSLASLLSHPLKSYLFSPSLTSAMGKRVPLATSRLRRTILSHTLPRRNELCLSLILCDWDGRCTPYFKFVFCMRLFCSRAPAVLAQMLAQILSPVCVFLRIFWTC